MCAKTSPQANESKPMKMSDLLGFIEKPEDFDILYQGHKVTYLNEAGNVTEDSKFFAAGFEFGAHVIVHVEAYRGDDGFETAYEAWIDSLPEIEKEEYLDIAYAEVRAKHVDDPPVYSVKDREERYKGVRDRAQALLDAAVEAARDGNGEWPELIEGYRVDSSGEVKSLGHYEWMHEADLEEIEIVRKALDAGTTSA
jgi:hypothetical protein